MLTEPRDSVQPAETLYCLERELDFKEIYLVLEFKGELKNVQKYQKISEMQVLYQTLQQVYRLAI